MFFINLGHRTFAKCRVSCFVGISLFLPLSVLAVEALSFEQAIKLAQQNDPWLAGNAYEQKSIELLSTSVKTLPDPKISLGLANLPTNGFDFGQEGMTQAKVGIAQVFPRGSTQHYQSEQLKIKSEAYPFQRKNREAQVAVTVGKLWLDSYKHQQSIALIEKNRSLFEQLADVAQASYSSALGNTRQQDIVRAQLELTRLEDRLAQLKQKKSQFDGALQQWITTTNAEALLDQMKYSVLDDILLKNEQPIVALIHTDIGSTHRPLSAQALLPYFSKHPSVTALDKKVNATRTGVKLAKQKYKPEWGVNASYGYRADDPSGNSRADLFSVGVTFDVPLFTENRQDKEVQSAIAKTESVKTEKLLVLRKLIGAYASASGQLRRIKSRQLLYSQSLIPQTIDQAEASLSAYTHDDGSFSDVVRSRIAVLNAEIDKLSIDVDEQKTNLELNYLFVGSLQRVDTKSGRVLPHANSFLFTEINSDNITLGAKQ